MVLWTDFKKRVWRLGLFFWTALKKGVETGFFGLTF